MKYNHDRPLSSFQKDIGLLRKAGFKPIAVSQMYLEDVFVFKTDKEAHAAYKLFEDDNNYQIIGWWYGEKAFIKEVALYEKENNGYAKVMIHWLEN